MMDPFERSNDAPASGMGWIHLPKGAQPRNVRLTTGPEPRAVIEREW